MWHTRSPLGHAFQPCLPFKTTLQISGRLPRLITCSSFSALLTSANLSSSYNPVYFFFSGQEKRSLRQSEVSLGQVKGNLPHIAGYKPMELISPKKVVLAGNVNELKNLSAKFMNESHKWLLRKPGLCLSFTIEIRELLQALPREIS